jgi:methionyl-tRNA formyltransferase
MKIVFMGTPDFASECLKSLVSAGHEIVAVYTQPDKPKGRKKILTPPDVKVLALTEGLEVRQPTTLKEEAENIVALSPDLIVVVAYGKILPESVLNASKYGSVNVHASLLPHLRGAAPIQWSIIGGDKKTGITTMYMDKGLDTGDMILKSETEIGENETFGELWERLKIMGAELLVKTVDLIGKGEAPREKQGEKFTYAPLITPETEKIDINDTAENIHNKVRGLSPAPLAYLLQNGKKLKISKTLKTEREGATVGEVLVEKNRIYLTAGDKKLLELLRLKAEGSAEMDAASFVNGRKITSGEILE